MRAVLTAITTALAMSSFDTFAAAETMKVDTLTVNLELPAGFCKLARDKPDERRMYDQQDKMQANSNVVMVTAVPCAELPSVRGGYNPKRWAIWLMTGPAGRPIQLPAGMSRQAALTEISKSVPQLDLNQISDEVQTEASKQGVGIKLNSMGVIAQDDVGLYAGLLADASAGTVKRNVAAVLAWAILQGRVFTFNLYQDYDNRQTFDVLLGEVKDTIARSTTTTDAIVVDKSLPPGMKKIP